MLVFMLIGEELSRRDDLEALGFIMIYSSKGPYLGKISCQQQIKKNTGRSKNQMALTLEELCEGCPKEFLTYMKHC